jgi:DNA-damage-inducible protein J
MVMNKLPDRIIKVNYITFDKLETVLLLTIALLCAIFIIKVMLMTKLKSNVNVKIDADVKELAAQLLANMGIDQTTAIDMFFRQIIAERRLPFQPAIAKTAEQVQDIIKLKNIPHKAVLVNEDGHIIADKGQDPELYDWAVNG